MYLCICSYFASDSLVFTRADLVYLDITMTEEASATNLPPNEDGNNNTNNSNSSMSDNLESDSSMVIDNIV